MHIRTFTGYVVGIMHLTAPDKHAITLDNGLRLEISIESSLMADGTPNNNPVWDSIYINGEWCGNRCGGVAKLLDIANQAEIKFENDPVK